MPRLFHGWWIVVTAALGLFFSAASLMVYTFSVFLTPLTREFHSTRAGIAFAFTLLGLAGAVSTLAFGRLVDRFGARRIVILSLAVFALILLSNRLFSGQLWHLYGFYLLLGLIGVGTGPLPYSDVISHWFDSRRGLALGLMMVGVGTAAIIMPPLMQRLITAFGWRSAYACYGAAVLIVAVPLLALFLKDRPESLGLLPDGASTRRSVARPSPAEAGLAWREVRRGSAFWHILAALVLVMSGLQACLVHLPAMLVDRGRTPQAAALVASSVGAAVLIGRVGTGYLLDRFFAPYVAAFFFAQAALGIAMLALDGPHWLPFVSAASLGLGIGAEVDIIAYLVSRYFGLRSFAEIYSYLWCGFVVAVAVGPFLLGLGFDKTGSYRLPLLAFVLAAAVGALLIARLGPYSYAPQCADPAPLGI